MSRSCAAAAEAARTILPSVEAWIPVGKPRFELRWFTEGDVPRRLRPAAPSLQRIDAYHLPSLTADVSIKRRGDTARLECKTRSHAESVSVAGFDAVAERWQKMRASRGRDHELVGPWLPVAKQIWSLGGIEIARVAVDGSTWWSLAFPLPPRHRKPNPLATRWLGHLDTTSRAASYASWLLDQLDHQTGVA
jgi:hypothetical protein